MFTLGPRTQLALQPGFFFCVTVISFYVTAGYWDIRIYSLNKVVTHKDIVFTYKSNVLIIYILALTVRGTLTLPLLKSLRSRFNFRETVYNPKRIILTLLT
jgi:hypothetical protein